MKAQIDEEGLEEINANTPIKHETINRKSNRISRSSNQDGKNQQEDHRLNSSDASSKSSENKENGISSG